MFIFPMWDNESERIGKQRCTPLGYALHGVAELLGFIGLLLLPGIAVFLIYRGITSDFRLRLLWLLSVPFALGIFAQVLYRYSWRLASLRKFQYDGDSRTASWEEDGKRVEFKDKSTD
jgi:hypothetical protein